MMIRWKRFNIYLLLALGLAVVWGCQSPEGKRKKQFSTLRVHLEVAPEGTDRNQVVAVYRQKPMSLTVEKSPFLTEGEVSEAKVVEVMGGFTLLVQFDRQGTLLLEQYSSANRGRRFAIFSQFVSAPDTKLNEGRWLAAPKMSKRITDGALIFTPDATREEAQQIALGLNNVAKKVQDTSK